MKLNIFPYTKHAFCSLCKIGREKDSRFDIPCEWLVSAERKVTHPCYWRSGTTQHLMVRSSKWTRSSNTSGKRYQHFLLLAFFFFLFFFFPVTSSFNVRCNPTCCSHFRVTRNSLACDVLSDHSSKHASGHNYVLFCCICSS